VTTLTSLNVATCEEHSISHLEKSALSYEGYHFVEERHLVLRLLWCYFIVRILLYVMKGVNVDVIWCYVVVCLV
jgi:hypothetical protein